MLQTMCRGKIVRSTVLIAMVLCLGLTAVAAFAEEGAETAKIPNIYRDSWKITVDGKPQATGTFSMIFTAYQSDPIKFTVNVMEKQKPKKVREDIWKELSIAAGANYKVKKSGDKVVTIKKASKKVPAISLRMDEQNLTGMSVMISKN